MTMMMAVIIVLPRVSESMFREAAFCYQKLWRAPKLRCPVNSIICKDLCHKYYKKNAYALAHKPSKVFGNKRLLLETLTLRYVATLLSLPSSFSFFIENHVIYGISFFLLLFVENILKSRYVF